MRPLRLVKILIWPVILTSMLVTLPSLLVENVEEQDVESATPTGAFANKSLTKNSSASVPPSAVLVLMIAYQRSGSSFLGELFNRNPDAFQWFEPLDGLYSAIYGTEYGFNVPADIWNFRNGSERTLPAYELYAVVRATADILNCRLDRLPTEILLHQFVVSFAHEQRRMRPYVDCIKRRSTAPRSKNLGWCRACNAKLSKACGQRFGLRVADQIQCAKLLLPELFPDAPSVGDGRGTESRIASAVKRYRACMEPCRARARACLPLLSSACESAPIRALKPVRFPMSAAGPLLEQAPAVRIVHNVRDPRGVALSRRATSRSFQALYAGAAVDAKHQSRHDVVREAELLCRNVDADVARYEALRSSRPDQLMRVVYEDYAARPADTAAAVYRFLGVALPEDVVHWLANNTRRAADDRLQTTRNSTQTASRWQNVITDEERRKIGRKCSNLLRLIDSWPPT